MLKSLRDYAGEAEGYYPTGASWCDVLVEHGHVRDSVWHLQRHDDGSWGWCIWAINENVAGRKMSDLPADVVVMFESEVGWNQHGGRELLKSRAYGGYVWVMFNDGSVEFMPKRNVDDLNWGASDE